jgi:dTDP-4-dehydrorhamnose reductase
VKYAVIGSAGQLGRDLCPRLVGDVVGLTRDNSDLRQPDRLRATLVDLHPDVVVNCAAYNFVDKAESEPDAAFEVNAWGVRSLAGICRDLDCVLLHFSTDYVFGLDASRTRPFEVDDAPGPVSVYGLSKLCGEYLVRSICPRHFVVRTCGLYGVWGSGGKGGNFVETMLRVASQGKPLRVVADQTCTPSYTVDVASATVALMNTGRYGLYHLTNEGATNWHEFARTIFELAGVKADLSPIYSQERNDPAKRPGYSALSLSAYESLGLPSPPSWRKALAAYLEERRQR